MSSVSLLFFFLVLVLNYLCGLGKRQSLKACCCWHLEINNLHFALGVGIPCDLSKLLNV